MQVHERVKKLLTTQSKRGFICGLSAGLALIAFMYLCNILFALRPLSQVLQQPLLDIMPGFIFGFLIDTLQHAGKVVEEAGLILSMLIGLGFLGSLYGYLRGRTSFAYLGMAVSLLGWVVVTVLLLPLSGLGFLGLGDSLTTPLLWAALFLIYAVILEVLYEKSISPQPDADPTRRQILKSIPLLVASSSLLALGLEVLPRWYSMIYSSFPNGPTLELTPVGDFYVVSKNFSDPVIDSKTWSLNIHGLVDHSIRLNYEELLSMPQVSQYVTLECISNTVGGPQISTGFFSGIPLKNVLAKAGVKQEATIVGFRSKDDYFESLAYSLIGASPEILLALMIDGEALSNAHGFPARILIPGHYGMKGPKWITDIELRSGDSGGYWEKQGWNPDAVVQTTARIDQPLMGAIIPQGRVLLSGVAFAGKRGIKSVQYSLDGKSWQEALIKSPLSELTWVTWSGSWEASPGQYKIQVRARDNQGNWQSSQGNPSYPSGSSGYHSISVSITRSAK